jgi:hypothetical protein
MKVDISSSLKLVLIVENLKFSSEFGRNLISQYGNYHILTYNYEALINDCDKDGCLTLKIQIFKPKRSKLKTLLDFYY